MLSTRNLSLNKIDGKDEGEFKEQQYRIKPQEGF